MSPYYVVVGAGIAGLRAATLLEAQGRRVLILESRDIPGGRMHTVYDSKGTSLYERGAWRVKGARAERLIRQHGGTLRAIRDRPRQERETADAVAMARAKARLRLSSPFGVRTLSARDVFHLAGFDSSKTDKGYHGIDDRAIGTRAYSTGGEETTDSTRHRAHYKVLEEGWSFLIQAMARGKRIRYGARFTGFDGTWVRWVERSGRRCKRRVAGCILAIPPHAFPPDDTMLRLAASTVESHALVHLWFKADVPRVAHVDFVSEGPISQIVANPLQPSNVVQVYACDRDANFWMRLYQSNPTNCLKKLRSELRKAKMPFSAKSIVDVCFWEHGVHSWRPVFGFPGPVRASQRALQPDPLHRPTLMTCGEAFSAADQGWADGAILTADAAVRSLLSASSKGKSKATTTPHMTMRFMDYDVRIPNRWLRHHPGGADSLLNHLGEDVTHLWQTVHGTGSVIANATLWYMLES